MKMKLSRIISTATSGLVLVALAACGGGGGSTGGGGGGITPPTSPPSNNPGPPPVSVSTPPPGATTLSSSTIVTAPGASFGTVNPSWPALGDTSTGGNGPLGNSTDGIPCNATMNNSSTFHRHIWLGIVVQGDLVKLPAGIGIVNPSHIAGDPSGFYDQGTCYYYIHTHDSSGYVHVEPADGTTYTLKDFFAVWGQQLTATDVAGFTAPSIQVFTAQAPNGGTETTNGWTQFSGDPNTIPLNSHTAIFLEVGPPFIPAAQLPNVNFYSEK
jgi:hypothetical protein